MPKTTEGWIPKQDRASLVCKECKEEKPPAEFVTRGTSKSGYKAYDSRCRACCYKHASALPSGKRAFQKRIKPKRDLVNAVKLKCRCCGYDRCKVALDLHHVDDTEKLFEISDGVSKSSITIEMLQEEMKKCVVLCSNCHRELHAGLEVLW